MICACLPPSYEGLSRVLGTFRYLIAVLLENTTQGGMRLPSCRSKLGLMIGAVSVHSGNKDVVVDVDVNVPEVLSMPVVVLDVVVVGPAVRFVFGTAEVTKVVPAEAEVK